MNKLVMKSTYPLPVEIEGLEFYHHPGTFKLESGEELPELTIGYHTFGKINSAKDNVVWVCHALTANSDVLNWWPGLFGKEDFFNPDDHFIVCANMLGSCYGTTGPRSINPETEITYERDSWAIKRVIFSVL